MDVGAWLVMPRRRRSRRYHDEAVKVIAYRIWEEEGRPTGRDLDHWLKAETLWDEQHVFVEHVTKDVEGCAQCT
jgi:hypothetical protein